MMDPKFEISLQTWPQLVPQVRDLLNERRDIKLKAAEMSKRLDQIQALVQLMMARCEHTNEHGDLIAHQDPNSVSPDRLVCKCCKKKIDCPHPENKLKYEQPLIYHDDRGSVYERAWASCTICFVRVHTEAPVRR